MKFAIITPSKQNIFVAEFADLDIALRTAGLDGRGVDHGLISYGFHRIGIIVYEFGLFLPPSEQSYFSINAQLYAGNAVLYGTDDSGATVDLRAMPDVFFMPNQGAVERSIELGLVHRPYMAVNDHVTWQWPQPMKLPR
jgi:hypothetical protein